MRLELHKKSNRQLAFIENTMIVCNSQNPCVSTCLSHAVLSKTQPPMQSIGSSSLWHWSPKNLDYSTNSHLGSCCLLTLLSIGFPRAHTMSSPQPMLHIFNLYLLLIVKPMHLLCSLPSAGSLRGSSSGVSGGGSQSCFLCSSRSLFSGRGNGSVSVLRIHVCIHICPWMSLILSQPGMTFSLWSVSTWTKDPQVWPWANPSYLSQNDRRAQDRVRGRLRVSCLIIMSDMLYNGVLSPKQFPNRVRGHAML